MGVTHDIFAETNPAYCTYALEAFVRAYISVTKEGPELPLAYLAVPIALSGELHDTFLGTNKNTGLLEWTERAPHTKLGLASRVNESLDVVTAGVRFSCFVGALRIVDGARLAIGHHTLKKSISNILSSETARSLKCAERIGYWFGLAGTTRTVFDIMGLTL